MTKLNVMIDVNFNMFCVICCCLSGEWEYFFVNKSFPFVNMFFCYSFNFRALNVTRLTVNVVGMWREYTSNLYIAPSSFYLLLSPLFYLYINKLEFFSCLWLLLTITSTWFDRCNIDNTIFYNNKKLHENL